ncbi:hypothetical protein MHM83_07095 [Tenacibaculum sp. Mcav3-52]|uniref:Uncharacterized protein n=1 Tax=Tenacibaculum mesophilum TaxID=104268 RepID=A0AAE9MQP8_9FLAO|nr:MULTISPECIES: hypothetical protein [Tenacibaculum]GFD80283.1 hypothetical protein KUL118_31450 [Tenacibaculum sp. KUL118]MCG7501633.1 hypothetical protein [Tenacibaculum sp. Mcav3-52]MCO7184921.1 hypothetical protein [Tenacibaculum sp. XPcli2-G]UTD16518.1 hypothetical protein HER15_13985 [Tenacibaculum mesophilum]BFF38347.1 hypothetical protein BACY1_01520 [Tenacibaculum mesophilum]
MKYLYILLAVIVITSCNLVKYTHSGDVNSRLDFRKGKWLLNDVTSFKNIRKDGLTEMANERFSELIGNRLLVVSNMKGLLIPSNISPSLDKSILKDIKYGTGYDYFIDIRTKNISNEVGVLGASNSLTDPSKNIGEVTLSIYDLNIFKIIYSQTVVGKLVVSEKDNDYALSKNSNLIIHSALKRIMKKIKKNQIKAK